MKEYPLYTPEIAAHCPTSRYVGGISRSLCECASPTKCKGALLGELAGLNVRFNRADYMASDVHLVAASREAGHTAHRVYHAQFVTKAVKHMVLSRFGIQRLQAAKVDPHLNTIPLAEWDRLALGFPADAAQMVALSNATTSKDQTRGISLSDKICVLKEAARQLIEEDDAAPRG